jgi:two-component system CheB/CheR fusion protein
MHDADATPDRDVPRERALLEQRLSALHTKAAQIQDGLGQAAREVQQLARGLVSVEVDARGLLSALCELALSVDVADGVRCSFTCDCPDCCEDGFDIHDSNLATQLYRIAQEAVSNAIKHGRASEIAIDLCIHDELTILRITDNGVGLGDTKASPGMGLRIMAHRAELIGAYLHFGPAARGGTEVTCAFHRPPTLEVSTCAATAALRGKD